MNERVKSSLAMFERGIPPQVRRRVVKMLVFGSHARWEGSKDSDLDIAVLMNRKAPELVETLDDSAYRTMWEHDFNPVISLKVFEVAEFADAVRKDYSFYHTVLAEGISL